MKPIVITGGPGAGKTTLLNALTKLGVQYQLSEDKTECLVEGLGRPFSVSEPGKILRRQSSPRIKIIPGIKCPKKPQLSDQIGTITR